MTRRLRCNTMDPQHRSGPAGEAPPTGGTPDDAPPDLGQRASDVLARLHEQLGRWPSVADVAVWALGELDDLRAYTERERVQRLASAARQVRQIFDTADITAPETWAPYMAGSIDELAAALDALDDQSADDG